LTGSDSCNDQLGYRQNISSVVENKIVCGNSLKAKFLSLQARQFNCAAC